MDHHKGPSKRSRRPKISAQDVAEPLCLGDSIRKLLTGKVISHIPTHHHVSDDDGSDRDEPIELDECALCANRNVGYGAVGKCNHPELMCWVCAIRLRFYTLRTSEEQSVKFLCPYDGALVAEALLTRTLTKWDSIDFRQYTKDPSTKLHFADEEIAKAFNILQEIRCWFSDCFGKDVKFDSMERLKAHLLDEHNRKFCDICYNAKHPQLFLPEHVLYDPLDLARHRRQGENQIEKHIFCRACRQYLYDSDAMELHWRGSDNHFCCTICLQNELTYVLYSTYEMLWNQHYSVVHYPCTHDECKQSAIVFANPNDLQLHMAKKHFESSEFYSNVGRRGVRINLSAYASVNQALETGGNPSQAGHTSHRSKKKKEPEQPSQPVTYLNDPVCALWPPEMVAESDTLLRLMEELPRSYNSYDDCVKAMTALYTQEKKVYFKTAREYQAIDEECRAMVHGKNPKPVEQCLGTIARIIYLRYRWWCSKQIANRMLPDDPEGREAAKSVDTKGVEELSPPKWLSYSSEMTMASEAMLTLLLAVPSSMPDTIAKMKEIVKHIAQYAPQARRDAAAGLKDSKAVPDAETDTPAEACADDLDSIESPTEGRDDMPPEVLVKACLPINHHISFLEAISCALGAYVLETEAETRSRRAPQDGQKRCPLRVPKNILARMRANYEKADLGCFRFVERDLAPYISAALLESFNTLYPWYRGKIEEIKGVCGEDKDKITKVSGSKRDPVKWSQEWGARCDSVFHRFAPAQLILLRHYVDESKSMEAGACALDPALISGIERTEIEKLATLTPQRPNAIYDIQKRTLAPDDFPSLPSPVQAPLPAAWTPSRKTRPAATMRVATATNHPRTAPALGPTRAALTARTTGEWGVKTCNTCRAKLPKGETVCQQCNSDDRFDAGFPSLGRSRL
eukprot:Blabericola_migrator_1__3278@NODE_1965_length_3490_cov_141_291557_g1249_i0_p1_GENE_NODE_1965_length_3490_cov_141_291557_g1249_i0NODE_1965_length_3490_cov_141_291557_g1249_i0_p1_ORF_typecomplete_len912_score138_07zfFCS/PF06467_14/0_011zfFCS/PF06467_14/6_5e03zfFCS/PF06467_14/1_5e02DZR/PF12773_7/1_5e02DZR/PF12773_7/0_04DUF3528/PF12045_8/1_5e03DUF3528/PF12045_8/1DUF3528/PF12045_8/2_7e03_NODE_1965_length_3490_cov_141_291557_g1249_i0522787